MRYSTAAAVVVVTALLAGCSPQTSGPDHGDIAAAAPVQLPEHLTAVDLRDGTFAVVDARQALPAKVRDALAAPAVAAVSALPDGPAATQQEVDAQAGIAATMERAADDIGDATGKKVVIVYSQYGGLGGSARGDVWRTTAPDALRSVTGANASMEKSTTVAATRAWVAGQDEPSDYEVVVID